MADNVLGAHVQGVSDEGNPVEDCFPVVVAFEDAAGNKEVPNIGPSGGVLVENAPGGPASTVNQGAPNAGGVLAWPVQVEGVPAGGGVNAPFKVAPDGGLNKAVVRTSSGTLTNVNDFVELDVHDCDTVEVSLGGSYTGSIDVRAAMPGGNFQIASFYSEAFQHTQQSYDNQNGLPDIILVGVTGKDKLRVYASTGFFGGGPFVGTPNVSVIMSGIRGTMVIYNVASQTFKVAKADGSFGGGTAFPADQNVAPPVVQEWTDVTALGTYEPLYIAVIPTLSEGGTTVTPERTPAKFKQATATAAGSTALWTPAAGKKFRLMRYMVVVTDDATQAAPGRVTVKLLDGAADIAQNHITFVPAVGLLNTGALYTSGWIDLGNGILSAAANNVLNINLSAALTAGVVNVLVAGTEG